MTELSISALDHVPVGVAPEGRDAVDPVAQVSGRVVDQRATPDNAEAPRVKRRAAYVWRDDYDPDSGICRDAPTDLDALLQDFALVLRRGFLLDRPQAEREFREASSGLSERKPHSTAPGSLGHQTSA